MNHIFRFFKNYIDFSAEGTGLEEFLTYCSENGIDIIYPEKQKYKLFGKIFSRDFKKLRKPAKKLGLKIKIVKKNGIYFFLKKNKSKIGFVSGIIFIICFNLIMNNFIWDINIYGNSSIKDSEILSFAKEKGLMTGTLAKKHFVQDIEWYILRNNPDLADVQINIQGSAVNILINEIKNKPKMIPDDDVPTNIVAKKYGIIEKIDVFDGQGIVKPGDAVMKGDLLVSAVYEDRHKKLTLKHARANIIARTDYNIDVEFPLEQKKEYTTGKKIKNYIITFLGKKIIIRNNKNNFGKPYYSSLKDIYVFGIKLPISVEIIEFFDVKQNNITYNFRQAKDSANKLLIQKEKEEMSGTEIISKKIKETIKNGKYIISADYVVLMNIAEEQAIKADKPWENTDDMS